MFKKVTPGEVLEGRVLLDADGWIDHPDFIRIDGVPDKVYSGRNTGDEGLACHSVVGEEPDEFDGVPNRFLSLQKDASGRYTAYAAASCMFILRKRMPHIQMYPVTASTWTSGSARANTTTWAMEAEGGHNPHDEPLTPHQENGFLVIASAWEQRKLRGCEVGKTARAHRDLVKVFGGNATACESGRYRNAWKRLTNGERWVEKEGLMAFEEDILLAMFSGAEEVTLGRDERIKIARYRLGEIVKGERQSLMDTARSAYVLAEAAKPEPRVTTIPIGTKFTAEVKE